MSTTIDSKAIHEADQRGKLAALDTGFSTGLIFTSTATTAGTYVVSVEDAYEMPFTVTGEPSDTLVDVMFKAMRGFLRGDASA